MLLLLELSVFVPIDLSVSNPQHQSTDSYSVSYFLLNINRCVRYKCRLHSLLSRNSLVDKFVGELEQFDQPNAVFKVSEQIHCFSVGKKCETSVVVLCSGNESVSINTVALH